MSHTVVHRLFLPFVYSHYPSLIWLMTHKRVDIKAERRGRMRQHCLLLTIKEGLRRGSDPVSFDYLLHSVVVKRHFLIEDKLFKV